jgi:tetratricopeptide (TPR) repeat protein
MSTDAQFTAAAVAGALDGDPRLALHLCQQTLHDQHLGPAQRFAEVDRLREAVAGSALAWLLLGSFQVDFAIETGVDLDRVLRWLEPMRARADEHLREYPGDADVHELWSITVVQLGDVTARTAGVSAGREFYLQAMEHARETVAEHPGDPRPLRRLGLAHSKIGNLAAESGDLAAAATAYHEGLRIAEEMARTLPEIALDDIAVSRRKLARIATERGDRDAAREHLEAARVAAERQVSLAPGDPDALRSLSMAYEHLGDAALEAGDPEAAREAYQGDFAIVKGLVRADPSHSGRQYDLAVCHQRLGLLAVAEEDLSTARREFKASLALGERLASALPDELMLIAHLASAYANLGAVAARRGEYAEAAKLLAREAAVLPRLVRQDPASPRWPARLEENQRERAELEAVMRTRRWPFRRRS